MKFYGSPLYLISQLDSNPSTAANLEWLPLSSEIAFSLGSIGSYSFNWSINAYLSSSLGLSTKCDTLPDYNMLAFKWDQFSRFPNSAISGILNSSSYSISVSTLY